MADKGFSSRVPSLEMEMSEGDVDGVAGFSAGERLCLEMGNLIVEIIWSGRREEVKNGKTCKSNDTEKKLSKEGQGKIKTGTRGLYL